MKIRETFGTILVTKALRFAKNANIKVINDDGTESTISLAELLTVDNDTEAVEETLVTEAGAGITGGTGTIYQTGVTRVGGIIKTSILIDLTGLHSTGADDIIGVDGTSDPCHIGQITDVRNGSIFSGRITCLEVPAGGDPDIDLYSADEATGVEASDPADLTETKLVDSGDHTLSSTKALTALPGADQYLYLVAGAITDADYTAGKFLIELEGLAA